MVAPWFGRRAKPAARRSAHHGHTTIYPNTYAVYELVHLLEVAAADLNEKDEAGGGTGEGADRLRSAWDGTRTPLQR